MRADVGFNEPDILLRNYLFNENFGRLNHQTEVAVIRAFEHVVVPISEML
jgi:carbamoyl-phosphate synthase large subunit